MAQRHRQKKMEHGKAQTKVAGDDEMLRRGFHDGTPLEGGKIADSRPVDLFGPATRLAHGDPAPEQTRGPQEEGTKEHVVAESEPVDLLAGGVAEANRNSGGAAAAAQGRQGRAEPTAGGRRLGRQ